MSGKKLTEKKRTERGRRRGKWEEEEGGNGRKREGKHYQTVQTYLELKGMGHVVSFSPLVFET
jgi:hypothetical protein